MNAVLAWHLSANFYPPLSLAWVTPAEQAIEAMNEGDEDRIITIPEHVEDRESGTNESKAWRIIASLQLEQMLDEDAYLAREERDHSWAQ